MFLSPLSLNQFFKNFLPLLLTRSRKHKQAFGRYDRMPNTKHITPKPLSTQSPLEHRQFTLEIPWQTGGLLTAAPRAQDQASVAQGRSHFRYEAQSLLNSNPLHAIMKSKNRKPNHRCQGASACTLLCPSGGCLSRTEKQR